jgi:RND family efflux transporter MFP subunit
VLESDLHASEQRQAEQLLRLAEAEYERTRSLHDQDIVSAQEALRSEIERDLAGSEVELASARLERCTVRAPFDGIIVERWVVVGQRVLEEDNEQLFRVVADDPVRARIHVPEQRLPGLQPGVRATIVLAGASVTRPAHVVFVSPAVDPASGTAPVIVEADAGIESHGIGASVNVRLEIKPASPDELSRLPRAAITDGLALEGEQATVLLAVAGQARTRAVEVVEVDGTQVVVRGSFDPGDRVILQSAAGLADGEAIRVAGEESP